MKQMMAALLLALSLNPNAMIAKQKTVKLRVIETSDVHGSFFPYDFINRKPKAGSLARVSSYVDSLRLSYKDNLILLENGDILQGQPTCYYYNYIATDKRNVAADVVNYLKYDAQTFGNHDVETGHAVYDKWVKELNCPVLGANIIETKTGKPYVKPYIILEREGVKVAVLGMLTPAIPNWLTQNLWSGLSFENNRLSYDLPKSSYAPGLISSPLHFWMPQHVCKRLQEGFKKFGKISHGFLTNEAVLIATETRTSSPVRITRDFTTLQHVRIQGLFPCGEGAGYAGGIVSAGVDGERCAEMCAEYLNAQSL